MITVNTVLILLGLLVNAGVIINHFMRLERRFTKIETFLQYKYGYIPDEQ